jgi:hypothetical protein
MTEHTDTGAGGTDDRWTQVTQRHYDPDRDTELTTAIVFALAEAEGISPSEVKSLPLYEVVNVAAIESVFSGPGRETNSGMSPGRETNHGGPGGSSSATRTTS